MTAIAALLDALQSPQSYTATWTGGELVIEARVRSNGHEGDCDCRACRNLSCPSRRLLDDTADYRPDGADGYRLAA